MVNRSILVGRVGQIEMSETGSGGVVARMRLVTSEYRSVDGERQESTEWHTVVFFGRDAEVVRDYVQVGELLYVEGRLRTRAYVTADGGKRGATEVHVRTFQMLTPKPAEQLRTAGV